MLGGLTNGTVAVLKGENVGRAVLKGGVVDAIGSFTSIGITAKFIGAANPSLLQAICLNIGVESAKTGGGLIFDAIANLISGDPQRIEFNLAEFSTNILIGSIMDFGMPRLQDTLISRRLNPLGEAWDGWSNPNYPDFPDGFSQTSMEQLSETYGVAVEDIILLNKAISHIAGQATSFINW